MVRSGETVVVADTAAAASCPAEAGPSPAVRYQVLCRGTTSAASSARHRRRPGQLALR